MDHHSRDRIAQSETMAEALNENCVGVSVETRAGRQAAPISEPGSRITRGRVRRF